jgi:predicted ATPase
VAFTDNCASLAAADIAAASHTPGSGWTVFDRGLVDAAIAIRHYTGTDATIGHDTLRSYHHRVFFTPPWEAILSTDAARRHSLAEATAEYERLVRCYKELGYPITVLPRNSVNDRVEQILRELRA